MSGTVKPASFVVSQNCFLCNGRGVIDCDCGFGGCKELCPVCLKQSSKREDKQ